MKLRAGAIVCLFLFSGLFLGHQYTAAQSAGIISKIGVVNIEQVMGNCKATASYKEKIEAEDAVSAEEQRQLTQDIQSISALIQSGALKKGSDDYMKQYQDMVQKKAQLDALTEFLPQKRTLQHQQWTEQLYQKILPITEELAKQQGLDMVLASEEVEFPINTYDELLTVLATHKVLYKGGCIDLTADVIAQLDAQMQQ